MTNSQKNTKDTSDPVSPLPMLQRLRDRDEQVSFFNRYGPYDDTYTITYNAALDVYVVCVGSSVWDGRGQETNQYEETESALAARLEDLFREGVTSYLEYQPRLT